MPSVGIDPSNTVASTGSAALPSLRSRKCGKPVLAENVVPAPVSFRSAIDTASNKSSCHCRSSKRCSGDSDRSHTDADWVYLPHEALLACDLQYPSTAQ